MTKKSMKLIQNHKRNHKTIGSNRITNLYYQNYCYGKPMTDNLELIHTFRD